MKAFRIEKGFNVIHKIPTVAKGNNPTGPLVSKAKKINKLPINRYR